MQAANTQAAVWSMFRQDSAGLAANSCGKACDHARPREKPQYNQELGKLQLTLANTGFGGINRGMNPPKTTVFGHQSHIENSAHEDIRFPRRTIRGRTHLPSHRQAALDCGAPMPVSLAPNANYLSASIPSSRAVNPEAVCASRVPDRSKQGPDHTSPYPIPAAFPQSSPHLTNKAERAR